MSEPIQHEFRSGINPDHAETFVKRLSQRDTDNQHVVVRFEGYPYVNAGVGWRIGNALRRYAGDRLEIHIPPFNGGKGEWFRSFTRSCLGDAFAAHAGRIFCGDLDVTEEVRSYYVEWSCRKSQNAVVTGSLDSGINVDPEREDRFRDEFLRSLRQVNVRPNNFERDRLQDVIKLVFEAIQNVYDHATRKPLIENTRVVSYCLIGYYKSIGNHPDPAGKLRGYLEHLDKIEPRRRADFIEVCVNDDGVGIAARQSQDPAIYWGAIEDEEAALSQAIAARSSVKLRANDTRVRGVPGQGYTYIESSLRALRAFAILRSGRLLAVLDGTNNNDTGFSLMQLDLGYMPGTTLDVLIPILKDADGQLTLFPEA